MDKQVLAIFGATGSVGRHLVDFALEAGFGVRALSRRPNALQDRPGLTQVTGDVVDPGAVLETLQGSQAVLVALGARARDRSGIRTKGTQVIVDGMHAQGITRVVCLSALGTNESSDGLPFVYRSIVFPLFLGPTIADHAAQETLLRAANLDLTLVRPPNFTDGPRTGAYAHGFASADMGKYAMKISRADVADLMLREITDPQYRGGVATLSYPKGKRAA